MDTLLTESMVVASLLLFSSEFLQELRGNIAQDGTPLVLLGYHGGFLTASARPLDWGDRNP
jgi:hypothetical protein